MVFSSIGNLAPRTVEAVALRCFGGEAATVRDFRRAEPSVAVPFDRSVARHTHQTHCIVGSRACGIDDARRLPLALAVNLLGGPSANSLLNVVLREKHGLSYNIEASYTPYTDCGIVAVYFSCDHANTEQCLDLVERELHRLCTVPLTPRRLAMAKRQFIAQLAISMESNEGYMLGTGKSFLLHDRVDTMEEVYAKIGALTASDLTAAAEEVFGRTSRLIYK